MLLDSNPHLLSAKDSHLSIRLSRNCDSFTFIKVIVPQPKAHILRRFPKIGRKVIEYSYVSGQCGQSITLFILTSIRFYFTLLAGNFLIILSSAVFFKINLLYSSQRVKQFGFRSGPIFCWS